MEIHTLENCVAIRSEIQLALTIDAINLIGLHKFVDFNLLDKEYKDLWYSLFTKFIPDSLANKKIDCVKRIKQSQKHCLLELLDDKHIKLIVDYTLYRIEHLKQLNLVLENYDFENVIKLVKDYEVNNPYLFVNDYPFLEYESEECYATI